MSKEEKFCSKCGSKITVTYNAATDCTTWEMEATDGECCILFMLEALD